MTLALRYANGKGVDINWYEAIKYLKLAAKSGILLARFYLGWCYEAGMGVGKNLHSATRWYLSASLSKHYYPNKTKWRWGIEDAWSHYALIINYKTSYPNEKEHFSSVAIRRRIKARLRALNKNNWNDKKARWEQIIINNDEVVLDNVSGLMWQRHESDNIFEWPDAKEYVKNIRTGGFADWRVPTIFELKTLVAGFDMSEDGDYESSENNGLLWDRNIWGEGLGCCLRSSTID